MIGHWLIYVLAVAGCGVFYWAYREWFSWLAFVGVACSCVASLLLSLPGMLRLRLKIGLPERVTRGTPLALELKNTSKVVPPPYKCPMILKNSATGELQKVREGQMLPTEHCCLLTLNAKKGKVYDYLGLFFVKLPTEEWSCLVMPQPVEIPQVPDLEQFIAASWKPKPGGGFSENHELREYRPGDKLNQVHWKLTAKTGDLVVREPMEPMSQKMLVDLVLDGTPDSRDKKLGQLLWLGEYLLEQGLRYEVRLLGADGICRFAVTKGEELEKAVEAAVAMIPAQEGQNLPDEFASWHYRIGGDEYGS